MKREPFTVELQDGQRVKVQRREVNACYRKDVGEWVVEWPDGAISVRLTPAEVLAEVRAYDARLTKRLGINVITTLHWWSPPEDFEVPR